MAIAEPWKRIIEYWRQSRVGVRLGVSLLAIESFQHKYGVALPADVREYLLAVDGSSDGPMDEHLFRFWPLSEIVPVHEELDERGGVVYPDRFAYPDCFVFADHLLNSWLYAVKLTADPEQPGPVYRVTASSNPGEEMSPSFKEFMSRYASIPSSIL
jgi:hypothetical protein